MNIQSDGNTLGNVTITDARQTPTPPVKEEKKTPEAKKLWQENQRKALDRVHKRMFPNAKEADEKPDKKVDKNADKVSGEKPAAKPEKAVPAAEKPIPAKDKDADKPSDSGEGKQGGKEEPKPEPSAKKEETQPPVDYEKLAKSVATATAKAIKESEPKPKEQKPTPVEDEVPEARRRDLEAVKHLDATNPRYKGKLEAYKKFAKDEAAYAAKWEKENPGREFDPESDDHSAWYDKHEPDIDPEDINEARVELAADRRARTLIEKETSATKQEIERLRLERDIERADMVAPKFINRNVGIIAKSMGDNILDALSKMKKDETFADSDPAAHAALTDVLPELNKQTVAAARIFGSQGRAYNEKDEAHVAVAKATIELESAFVSMPEDKRTMEDGRKYATLDDWANMDDAARAKHWTIDADIISAHLAAKAGEKASAKYKSEREKLEKIAKAYGYVKTDAAPETQTKPADEQEETPETTGKTRSPSTSTKTIIQPGAKVDPQTAKDAGDMVLNKMFRR